MGKNTHRNFKLCQVMYEILQENPDGLTSDQINYMLNNSIRPNKSSHTKSRLGGEGYSIRQIAGILRGNTLFSKESIGRHSNARNLYFARPLEEAYELSVATKKDMKKFPKIIRDYHTQKGELNE